MGTGLPWYALDVSVIPSDILAEASVLFHDVDPRTVDPEIHESFVIARVLDRGTLKSVGALLRFYGKSRVRRFFLEGGTARLSPRTVPLWLAYFDLAPEQCTPKPSLRPSATFWTE